MIFSVQVSNPAYSTIVENDYYKTGELLEDIVSLNTEYCIIFWNHVSIPLSYKYDISIILDDIIFIIDELSINSKGNLDIDWPSNTFSASWNILWDNEDIIITSKWHNIIGNIESLLNNANRLCLKKADFLAEWKKLLEKIIEIINDTNYPTKDTILVDLYRVNSLLNKYGVLYE